MHSNSIQRGDTWLHDNLDAYGQWAQTHNSLLVVTFDEDNGSAGLGDQGYLGGAANRATIAGARDLIAGRRRRPDPPSSWYD